MKKISLSFNIVFVLLFTFSFVSSASAHGGEPRLEISADRVNPGGTVNLRGVDFEPESLVTLSLSGPAGEISLGEVTADVEGSFLQIVIVPADLMQGSYAFHAATEDHEVFSPSLTISGPAILEGEDGGQRELEEPLLAPMPTPSSLSVGSPAVPIENPDVQTEATPARLAPGMRPLAVFAVIFLALGFLFVLGKRIMHHR